MKVLRVGGCAALMVGVVLTACNLYGLTAAGRQDVQEPRLHPPPGKSDWVTGSLLQRRGEADEAYFRRLTMSVHYRIVHSGQRYVVPLHENWILRAAAVVVPSYRDYEFADYHRAMRRGAGICTQFAAAIFDVLKRQGIRRRIFEFVHHTVVEAQTRRDRKLILDGDFGLVIARPMSEVRRDTAIVRPYYAALDPAETMFPHYTPRRFADEAQRGYSGPAGPVLVDESTPQRAVVERVSYTLKWPLPIALALAGAAMVAWRPRHGHRTRSA